LIVDIARVQESQEKVSRPRLRDEGLLVFPAENDKTFPIVSLAANFSRPVKFSIG
jgi:hypothetical protein